MKIVPSIAYLRVYKQAFVGYSMALAGWIGEHLLNEDSLPKPIFFFKALRKLNFKFIGEDNGDDSLTQFFSGKNVGITVSFEPFNDSLFLQIYPLKRRISPSMTIRAQYIEFYDQFVVSVEPAQRLPHGIRSVGINALIIEDSYPISRPYWGMVHEDWENNLRLLVMLNNIYDELEEREYRCPICFSSLRREGEALKCDSCGFVFTSEENFDKVLSEFSLEVGEGIFGV